jgi:tetratricopeptide (TPR) repeat protein
MTDSFENIEAYFEGRSSNEEKQLFEDRCARDEAFAKDVAFYIATREALREELLTRKKAEWQTLVPAKNSIPSIRILYIAATAAAMIVIIFCLYLVARPSGPRQLATSYLENNFSRLRQTMNGSMDSLQHGISAYNDKDYPKAIALFTAFARSHPGNSKALEYSGLAYLRLKDYDKALEQFYELAKIPGLFSNPGLFLQAVTLLYRDAAGDRPAAKALLQEVVRQQLEGAKEAADWLTKF